MATIAGTERTRSRLGARSARLAWPRRLAPLQGVLGALVSVALALAVWQLAIDVFEVVDPKLFPPPTEVASAARDLWAAGLLWSDLTASLGRLVKGLLLGAVVGVVVGVATARLSVLRWLLAPLLQLLRPIPAIAFVPLAVIWFGLDDASKLFIVGTAVFFPVWLNTHLGIERVNETYRRVAASLELSARRRATAVLLPAAAPFIVAGLRVGIALGFVSLVAAELTGASSGVGYRIAESNEFFRVDRMMVGLVELGIFGALLDAGAGRLAKRVVHWSE